MTGARPRGAVAAPAAALALVLGAAGVTTAPLAAQGVSTQGSLVEDSLVQDTAASLADYSWALLDLDGRSFRLERYRGRPLVLNLWATWCAPCVRELPTLQALAASVEGTGVVFLLVSPEAPDRAADFLRRHGVTLPAAVEDQRMPRSFGLEALPTTWILDADGRVVLKHRGATDWNRDPLRVLLRRLAEQTDPPPR